MSVMKSMYEVMDSNHKEMMDQNQEHLENMLEYAIDQLVELCEENDVMLVDNARICTTYDQIFNCLKHWSEKRIANVNKS